jgi:subtilase family serine protease
MMDFALHRRAFALALHAGVALSALQAAPALAVPFPTRDTPAALDVGPLAAGQPITLTVPLKLRDPIGAEAMLKHVSTPGDALYRKFLTPSQFQTRFGPADADVAKVTATLTGLGLTVERASSMSLHVTGTPAAIARAFGVTLHQYSVAATKAAGAYSFHAPAQAATLPPAIAGLVHGVLGLDSRPAFSPHLRHASGAMRPASAKLASPRGATPPDPLGYWTVDDFADYYDVKPLYRAGITGAGQTIGIATLASFTPSDAYSYWAAAGLHVDKKRIRVYNVAGGAGAPSDDAGSGETTLDVEQSGGVAPGANILVYVAPNTTPGFYDLFGKAIDENMADAISCSWGSWEWLDDLANSPVREKGNPEKVSTLDAVHALFVQAGIQGQSLFTSSGDAGAYDANDGLSVADYSLALSVDYPASDPANTAAGGTTLAGTQIFTNPPMSVTIPAERVWSWDYLVPLCNALGYPDPISCGIFPVGSGGGVSVEFSVPAYQSGVAGVQVSQPNQVFTELDTVPPQILYTLPSGYAGRNVPDISLNADPDTGYLIGYTSSAPGSTYGYLTFSGGTSFVGPQLNGITQLLAQKSGGRMGFLNPTLYALAATPTAYHGPTASLNYIKTGNNDFYYGHKFYTPATGLGTIDVAKLANAIATPTK